MGETWAEQVVKPRGQRRTSTAFLVFPRRAPRSSLATAFHLEREPQVGSSKGRGRQIWIVGRLLGRPDCSDSSSTSNHKVWIRKR